MRILYATDGSADARTAADFLNRLPLPAGSALHVLTVAGQWNVAPVAFGEASAFDMQQMREAEFASARQTVAAAQAELEREGVTVTGAVEAGETAFHILNAAEAFSADLILVGSKGLAGIEGFLMGSVARNVAKHAHCPVCVARTPHGEVDRVILAVDGSKHSDQALAFTEKLPLVGTATITVAHVVRPYDPYPGLVPDDPAGFQREVEEVRRRRWQVAERLVEQARQRLQAAGKTVAHTVLEGDPAGELIQLASDDETDLIIAGARGVSLIQGLMVGSVADRLLKKAPCSVLIVH